MRIVISAEGGLSLENPEEFTAFSVGATATQTSAVLEALEHRGAPAVEDNHVFVTIEAVRALAGEHKDAEWEAGFAKMVAYAGSSGWLNDAGDAIKAHVEQL